MKIVAVCLMGFFGFTAIMYFLQDSLIFFPSKIDKKTLQVIRDAYPNIEELTLTVVDKINLRGWLIKNSASKKSSLVIYFGGNAEEVSHLIGEADGFKGWSLALMNYRGYGLSDGKPGEKELFNDALFIYDYFSKRDDIDKDRIAVMGRSIGAGVATYLAQNRSLKAAILVCPFDSLVSIGKKYYPFLPISLLLKHRFDSLSRASAIRIPLLALVAESDSIVPRENSMRLIEQWAGQHTVKVIEGDHNTLQGFEGYWESIQAFLEQF